jgi:prepilin peptidase CpaA
MWEANVWEHSASIGQWGVAVAASLAAAISDLRSGRIPNLLTGPLLLAGLAWALWVGGGTGLALAVAGAFLLALPFLVLFAVAGGGAGDAKLMGAIGAWLGPVSGVLALLCVVLAGAGFGLVLATRRQRHGLALERVGWMIVALVHLFRGQRNHTTRSFLSGEDMQAMPYGVAIFAGVCLGAAVMLLWHVT